MVRDGRQYYLGVGLSDVPLVSKNLPCSADFSAPCAEDWALSVTGYRRSNIEMAPTNEKLREQLELQYETNNPISSGGSPHGFRTTVFTASSVLVSDNWKGNATVDWLLASGLASDTFGESPEGR